MPKAGTLRALIAVVLLLVVAGCGGAATPVSERTDTTTPTTTDTSSPTPEPTDTDESDSPSPTPPPTTEKTDSVDPVAYVPWGPADPVIPEHYGQLARRDCAAAESVAPDGEFWDAVFAVCRSLTEGAAWPDLSTAPEPPDTDNPHDQCLNAELATMVSNALAWHDANGDAEPSVTYAGSGSPCYLSVYAARQLPAAEDGTAPGADQTTVTVLVDSTYDVVAVSVDGSDVSSSDYFTSQNDPFIGTTTISIHVPIPDAVTEASIEIALAQDGSERGTVSSSVEVSPSADGTEDESSPDDSADDSESDAS